MEQSLTDKYRPKVLDDVFGHPSAISDLKDWASNWSSGENPVLLHGDAGTGKTSTAEALSNEFGWNYVEINASENRKKEDIDGIVRQIRSSYGNKTLFVFDEVDSIDGRSLSSLYSVLDNSPNPVICTANEKWKVPDGLENRCDTYKFNLKNNSIKKFLKHVVEEEDIDITNRQIGQLATRNGIRDALNDLEEFIKTGKTDWDARDTEDSPFGVTRRVILNENYLGDMTPDDLVEFLNENVKNEFDGVEAMRAYQALSEADKWQGKVERNQDYSWWGYVSPIAEEISNMRLSEPYSDWVNVNYPSSRRNYTDHANSDSKEAQFYREINKRDGVSVTFNFNEFKKVVLPIIKDLAQKDREGIAISFGLSDAMCEIIDVDPEDMSFENREKSSNDPPSEEKNDSSASIFDF